LNNKGWSLGNLGKHREAITYYDRALEIDPDYVYALNNKGWSLYNLGKYREAITYYDRALEIDPDDVDALNNKEIALKENPQDLPSTTMENQESVLGQYWWLIAVAIAAIVLALFGMKWMKQDNSKQQLQNQNLGKIVNSPSDDKIYFDQEGYNRDGFDQEGYDRDGYDKKGYDRKGYDRSGYDIEGYDRKGYDRKGYNKSGYDRDGNYRIKS